MRRVRYGVASSLDGFIAGPDGEADWILMDPEIDFATIFAEYDTLLMGRKTFAQMKAMGQALNMPGVATYVFSASLRQDQHPDVTVVNQAAADVVNRLREQPGKDIALFGGGELFRSLLDVKLVDRVEVAVVPVLLGAGVPLMAGPYARVALHLIKHEVLQTTGTLRLTYELT